MPAENEIVFTGIWDSTGIDLPFQNSMNKMEAGVTSTLGKMSWKVSKINFLLVDLGAELGKASAGVTKWTSSIGYLLTRFNPLEAAIIGVSAAIGGLAWVLNRETEEEEKWQKRIKEDQKQLEEQKKSVDALILSKKRQLSGLDDELAKIDEIRTKRLAAETEYKRLVEERDKAIATALVSERAEIAEKYDEKLTHLATQIKGYLESEQKLSEIYDQRVEQLGQEANIRLEMEKEYDKYLSAQKKAQENIVAAAKMRAEEEKNAYKMMSDAVDEYHRRQKKQIELEEAIEQSVMHAEKSITDIIRENEERREAIRESAAIYEQQLREESIRAAEEEEKYKMGLLENSLALASTIGEMVTKGTKYETAAKIAAIVLEAGVRSAFETAAGFASLGEMNFWAAAQHFTSAALYAAVGVSRAISTAQAGGRGNYYRAERERTKEEMGRGGEEKRQIVVVINGNVLGTKESGRQIREWIDEAYYQEHPGASRSEVKL